MPKIKTYAVAVTRTVTYVEVLTISGEDISTAHDAAIDRACEIAGDYNLGNGFKYLGHQDHAQVLDVYV